MDAKQMPESNSINRRSRRSHLAIQKTESTCLLAQLGFCSCFNLSPVHPSGRGFLPRRKRGKPSGPGKAALPQRNRRGSGEKEAQQEPFTGRARRAETSAELIGGKGLYIYIFQGQRAGG